MASLAAKPPRLVPDHGVSKHVLHQSARFLSTVQSRIYECGHHGCKGRKDLHGDRAIVSCCLSWPPTHKAIATLRRLRVCPVPISITLRRCPLHLSKIWDCRLSWWKVWNGWLSWWKIWNCWLHGWEIWNCWKALWYRLRIEFSIRCFFDRDLLLLILY